MPRFPGDNYTEGAAFLQTRINLFNKALEGDTLTPLLRREMKMAIELFTDACKLPEIDGDHSKVLNKTYYNVLNHWTDVYGDLPVRARLLYNIQVHQGFLTIHLIGDYVGRWARKSPIIKGGDPTAKWVIEHAKYVKDYRGLSDGDTSAEADLVRSRHRTFLRDPCREMMVDETHVSNIICNKASERPDRTELRRAIAERDWASLAGLLFHDRKLAVDLFGGKKRSVGPSELWAVAPYPDILRGIDKVQGKYFQRLPSPSAFTLTKCAKRLSAKTPPATATLASRPGGSQSSPCSTERERRSWTIRAIGLCKNVIDGLHNEPKETDDDDATDVDSLIKQKEKVRTIK